MCRRVRCPKIKPRVRRGILIGVGIVSLVFAVRVLIYAWPCANLNSDLRIALLGLGISMAGLGFQFLTMSDMSKRDGV